MPGVPPVPIPNTAVKPRAANGSRTLGPARVGRCQGYGPDDVHSIVRASFFYTSRLSPKGNGTQGSADSGIEEDPELTSVGNLHLVGERFYPKFSS